MIDIPSPLKDVMTYQGVLDSDAIEAASLSGGSTKVGRAVRWGILGLPGMGKTSLCKVFFQKMRNYFPIFIIPEAADYAVKVRGYALIEFEPFLNQVYEQAEALAHSLANSISDLVIAREPDIIQNEVYLIVQKAYKTDSSFRAKLRALAYDVQIGKWEYEMVDEISHIFKEHRERLLNLGNGPWLNAYAMFTTEDPIKDLALSIDRQHNPDRDPRLVTNDVALLCGYNIGINRCATDMKEHGFHILTLDPRNQVETLMHQLSTTTLAMRSQAYP